MCPRNAGLCSSRMQAVDAFGGSARLSWSEPPSRSNLPKDPPSKTATLHKKDDTDTRIISKSCGTACSLQQFQRLTANFLLSVCLCSASNFDYNRTETRFMRIPKCCAMWLKGAPRPGLWLQLIFELSAGKVFIIPPPLKYFPL